MSVRTRIGLWLLRPFLVERFRRVLDEMERVESDHVAAAYWDGQRDWLRRVLWPKAGV